MTGRTAWLCDFDGTISPTDIGASLFEAFAPGAAGRRREMFRRWVHDEIGSRELTLAECEDVRVEEGAAREFIRRFRIDADFAGFAEAARARGDEVVVVSDGFDFYIHEHLERAGLRGLPVRANVARFVAGTIEPEFPWRGGCGRCGNCKAIHVADCRERGFRTVLVGDGYSDRCAARVADAVIAKGSLLGWCRAEGRPVTEFEDFARLSARLAPARPPETGPAAAPRPASGRKA